VTARAEKSDDWKCGASRDLPIEDSDAWDGSSAEASMFEWAGGDDFDPSKARKGFLAYNAAKPKERGSYKLPIAHVVDGRLRVPKGAIRAAASRLPQADIPDTVKESARKVLDHYEEKAGMSDSDKGGDRAVVVKHRRALERAPKIPLFKRGLYEVAQLASILGQVGYCTDCSEWEAEIEEDESKVPAMLGEALKQLGNALVAMTQEEVAELLAMHDEEDGEEGGEERAYVLAGKTPRARAWRRAIIMTRAGKSISASNAERLEDGQDHLERAMKHHRSMAEHHEAVAGHLDEAQRAHERALKAHGELGEALDAVKNEPEKATEHVARALKLHRALASHHEDIGDAYSNMDDRHQDAGDSHAAMGRSVRACMRCMRAVVEGATLGGEDSDSKDVQTSAGTGESGGSENSRSLRNRKEDLQRLAKIAESY
jgi:tetratricopeptide (TPR) repeat protein